MAGILKVDKYQDFNGNDIMTSDGAGNVTVNATGLQNTPAFEAYLSASQAYTNNTATKLQFNTKTFDTNNCYDNTTNYRFTPNVAGKYFVYAIIYAYNDTVSNNLTIAYIYKNGSAVSSERQFLNSISANALSINICGTYDMNGTTDYLEIYGQANGSDGDFFHVATKNNLFGGYKLIGA